MPLDQSNPSKNEIKQASGLVRYRVECVGISPLLMNAMAESVLLAMRDKSAKKSKASQTVLTPREECLPKLYLTSVDGKDVPIIPGGNLFSCLKEAGRQVRLDGKKQISTAKSTVLPMLMTLETTEALLVDDAGKPSTWEVDIKKGVNPNGGEAVVIIRPRFDRWRFTCTIQANMHEVNETALRRLFDVGGTAVGLGDFRPSRGGVFGRFRVDAWQEIQE